MKKVFLPLVLLVSLMLCSAVYANDGKMSIDPGWGAPSHTYLTFVSFEPDGSVKYGSPIDLGYTLKYSDIAAEVSQTGLMRHRAGYPDILLIKANGKEYIVFVYYDSSDTYVLNLFAIDSLAFYNVMIF